MKMRLEDLPEELPFRMAEWHCEDGTGHTHQAYGDIHEDGIEGTATLLAEAILACNEAKHKGHGRGHSLYEARKAYDAAITQLLLEDDRKTYAELKQKIARAQKWGGPVPELVLTPNPEKPGEWDAIVSHPVTGEPSLYAVRGNEVGLPDPREIGAKPHPLGLGWLTKRKRK